MIFTLFKAQHLAHEKRVLNYDKTITNHTRHVPIGAPDKPDSDKIRSSRGVSATVVTSPALAQTQLERLEPREQPTPPPAVKAAIKTKQMTQARWRLVYNAVATSAGVFQINETEVTLPSIIIVSAHDRCILSNGKSWPCGMVARTSLRQYIKGRALNCKLPDQHTVKKVTVTCLLQGQDLSAWLVASGWAHASKDGPYVREQIAAEAAQLGIFGEPPNGIETISP